MEYNGKKALVCGMARSGIAAAKLLNRLGARVTLQDMKKREEISADVLALEGEGIVLYTGANPDEIACAQDLIVLSPGIPCDLPFIAAAEEAGIEVISEVELAYRLTPCPITAITGTNGKTTTTTLTGEIMKTAYSGTAVVGNIGIPYSEEVERLTEKDWVVAEISSFQMEKAKEFHPHISAVLNITPDHLNRHKTMDVYIAMKERVFAKQTAADFCILNHGDEICRKMADKTAAKVFFFDSSETLAEGIYLDGDAYVTVAISIVISIAAFMLLPYALASLCRKVGASEVVVTIVEAFVKLGLFMGYMILISRMKDIQRTFMYHGAEHKCINCVENGKPLTVENVLESSRFHRRCGTSFLFLVMIVSIFLHFIFVLVPSYWFRLFGRLLMVPVVSGISFEIIQWAGRTDSKFALMMSKPGMAMQKFTTKEPTADMAEVAIKAVEAVFDWRAYLKTEFNLDIPYENKENGDFSAASAQSESGESEERTGNVPETGAAQ